MFGRVKDLSDLALQIFEIATVRGFYFLPFLIASAYLLLFKKENHQKILKHVILPCVIGLVILLSPLVGKYGENHVLSQVSRLYWPLPMDFAIIYCVVELFSDLKDSSKKVIALGALTILLLTSNYHLYYYVSKNTVTWPHEKAANPYKITAVTYEICNVIAERQDGVECRAAFPYDIAIEIRQYDARIMMPYGAHSHFGWWMDIYQSINADSINLDSVDATALNNNLDYFVLDEGRIDSGSLQNYSLLDTVQDGETTYGIYARQAA